MKRKSLIAGIAIMFMVAPLFSQNYAMKKWNWTQNRISFETPKSMKIKKNTGSYFSGSWGAMGFAIMPFRDKNLNASQVAFQGYMRNTATLNKKVTRKMNVNLGQGLKGYAIFGTGIQKGKTVKFVYLGLVDPRSPHNYSVNWVWYSNASTDKIYDRMSYRMAKSFRKI